MPGTEQYSPVIQPSIQFIESVWYMNEDKLTDGESQKINDQAELHRRWRMKGRGRVYPLTWTGGPRWGRELNDFSWVIPEFVWNVLEIGLRRFSS